MALARSPRRSCPEWLQCRPRHRLPAPCTLAASPLLASPRAACWGTHLPSAQSRWPAFCASLPAAAGSQPPCSLPACLQEPQGPLCPQATVLWPGGPGPGPWGCDPGGTRNTGPREACVGGEVWAVGHRGTSARPQVPCGVLMSTTWYQMRAGSLHLHQKNSSQFTLCNLRDLGSGSRALLTLGGVCGHGVRVPKPCHRPLPRRPSRRAGGDPGQVTEAMSSHAA